jgi:mRNA interferase RelE/StbE
MKYKIVLSRAAEKVFKHLNPGDFKAISAEVDLLVDDPWPVQSGSVVSTKNKGKNYYKLRVREFRIIYAVDMENVTIYIERIARRNEKTYKNL